MPVQRKHSLLERLSDGYLAIDHVVLDSGHPRGAFFANEVVGVIHAGQTREWAYGSRSSSRDSESRMAVRSSSN
jgi:hypothetical protein